MRPFQILKLVSSSLGQREERGREEEEESMEDDMMRE
jgi:hypothetical protein